MKSPFAESSVRPDLAAAARWRLLGLLLERPRPGWKAEVRALARETADSRLEEAADAAQVAEEGDYLRVLGPGGHVSPREVSYRGMRDPGQLLAGVRATYEAFAYRPESEDPLDHIAVELGFVGYLTLKLAYAHARGDGEAAKTTQAARTVFIAEHLVPFVPGLAAGLGACSVPHLRIAAASLTALPELAGAEARSEAPMRPGLNLLGRDTPEDELTCGGCPSD